jgi:hypothetical protein
VSRISHTVTAPNMQEASQCQPVPPDSSTNEGVELPPEEAATRATARHVLQQAGTHRVTKDLRVALAVRLRAHVQGALPPCLSGDVAGKPPSGGDTGIQYS